VIETAMSRMRWDEDANTGEEFPPRSAETGRWLLSPNDPAFVPREPWLLDGTSYDANGDLIQ
jgi:hypothetical protein